MPLVCIIYNFFFFKLSGCNNYRKKISTVKFKMVRTKMVHFEPVILTIHANNFIRESLPYNNFSYTNRNVHQSIANPFSLKSRSTVVRLKSLGQLGTFHNGLTSSWSSISSFDNGAMLPSRRTTLENKIKLISSIPDYSKTTFIFLKTIIGSKKIFPLYPSPSFGFNGNLAPNFTADTKKVTYKSF